MPENTQDRVVDDRLYALEELTRELSGELAEAKEELHDGQRKNAYRCLDHERALERLQNLEAIVGDVLPGCEPLSPIDSRLHGTGLAGCVSIMFERLRHVETNSHSPRPVPSTDQVKALARQAAREDLAEAQDLASRAKAARKRFRGDVIWVTSVGLLIATVVGGVGFLFGLALS